MMAIRPEAVQLEFRAIDLEEESKIDHFYSTTCGCLKACIKQFTHEHVKLTRANAAQLSRSDLDMALLGQVMASTHCSQLNRMSLMTQIHISRGTEIVSYFTTTQNKLHQSNNAFQHTHNPVDEEGTQKLIKVIKVHNARKYHSIQY